MKRKEIIGIIPARYSSTRFFGKLLALIHGKTLLQRTFENSKKTELFDEIYIATDDEKISIHANGFGANVIMTPSNCISGTERLAYALQKTEEIQSAKIIFNIQGDHPCISQKTIKAIINTLQDDENVTISTAVSLIEKKEDIFSPHVVKCVMDKSNYALYFSRHPIPFARKEKNVSYFHHLGIYAYRPSFLLKYFDMKKSVLEEAEELEQLQFLENGFQIKVSIVDEPILAVDVPEDIKKVEKVLWQ